MTGANGKLLQCGKEYTEIHFMNLAEHIAQGHVVEVTEAATAPMPVVEPTPEVPVPAPEPKKTKSTPPTE